MVQPLHIEQPAVVSSEMIALDVDENHGRPSALWPEFLHSLDDYRPLMCRAKASQLASIYGSSLANRKQLFSEMAPRHQSGKMKKARYDD